MKNAALLSSSIVFVSTPNNEIITTSFRNADIPQYIISIYHRRGGAEANPLCANNEMYIIRLCYAAI